jgi:Helix-turn-helix
MKPRGHAVRDLGQAIKRLRVQRKMTQQELADASGLDISVYRQHRGRPTKSDVRSAARDRVCVWDEDVRVAEEREALR